MSSVKDYESAKSYLGAKSERPIAHNTRIKAGSEDEIIVTYHDNPIVYFYPDKVIFTSSGWRTMTTKERLNWYMPEGWRVYQERGMWYVWNYGTGEKHTFDDGITYQDGMWLGYAPENAGDEIKARTKQIKKYVSGYVTALLAGDVSAPSGGDCWYCALRDVEGNALGDVTGNTDHLESHFEESYYVPSLLINAEEFHPACAFTKDGIARMWKGESISEWQKSIIRRDVTSSLTKYLKFKFGIAS